MLVTLLLHLAFLLALGQPHASDASPAVQWAPGRIQGRRAALEIASAEADSTEEAAEDSGEGK